MSERTNDPAHRRETGPHIQLAAALCSVNRIDDAPRTVISALMGSQMPVALGFSSAC
jgi:hypothetical protein